MHGSQCPDRGEHACFTALVVLLLSAIPALHSGEASNEALPGLGGRLIVC